VKNATVARNYAEALIAVAERSGEMERYGDLIGGVAAAVRADQRIALVLESPRVPKGEKARLLEEALEDSAPPEFVRFLQAVIRRGRQSLLGDIAEAYEALVDTRLNRVHAGIVVAREPDAALRRQIVERLGAVLGKEVRPVFRVDPGILGGVVVRVGDRIFDGSLRRRINLLRRKMLGVG
jgi:F-type H+-transporting ATPase subunit delta